MMALLRSTIIVQALALAIEHAVAKPIPLITRQTIEDEYDFVICGGSYRTRSLNGLLFPLAYFDTDFRSLMTGGTAGLVLANRLTESGNQRVLVLEAGQEPTIVAAYSTPGGNQFLKGKLISPNLENHY